MTSPTVVDVPRQRHVALIVFSCVSLLLTAPIALATLADGLWPLALACALLAAGFSAMFAFAAWGRTRVVVTAADLVVEHCVWRVRQRSTYPLTQVSRLRTVTGEWEHEPSTFAFDYALRTVTVRDLDPDHLRPAIARVARAVTDAQRAPSGSMPEAPLGWRVTASSDEEVVLEPAAREGLAKVGVTGVMVTIMAITAFNHLQGLTSSGRIEPSGLAAGAFLLVLVGMGLISVLTQLGCDSVRLTPRELQLGRRYGPWAWRRRHAHAAVRRLRAERGPDTGGWSLLGYSTRRPSDVWQLVLDCDGAPVCWGGALSEGEARWLARTLSDVGVGSGQSDLDAKRLRRVVGDGGEA